MGKRSLYTDATLRVADQLVRFQEAFRQQIPASFMREQMTPREFKAHFGMGVKTWQELENKHTPEVMQSVKEFMEQQNATR